MDDFLVQFIQSKLPYSTLIHRTKMTDNLYMGKSVKKLEHKMLKWWI
jgi:hypothetical protein